MSNIPSKFLPVIDYFIREPYGDPSVLDNIEDRDSAGFIWDFCNRISLMSDTAPESLPGREFRNFTDELLSWLTSDLSNSEALYKYFQWKLWPMLGRSEIFDRIFAEGLRGLRD